MSSNYKRGKKSKCGSVKDIPQVKYVESEDPSLSLERLLKFPKRKWKWDLISSHPNLDYLLKRNSLKFEWNWKTLSKHINLNIEWLKIFLKKTGIGN